MYCFIPFYTIFLKTSLIRVDISIHKIFSKKELPQLEPFQTRRKEKRPNLGSEPGKNPNPLKELQLGQNRTISTHTRTCRNVHSSLRNRFILFWVRYLKTTNEFPRLLLRPNPLNMIRPQSFTLFRYSIKNYFFITILVTL